MLKNYIKIAWKVLLRRKFFTFVSLFGISFTLLVLMLATAAMDFLASPGARGSRLDRTLFIDRLEYQTETTHMYVAPSYWFLDRHVHPLKTPEMTSISTNGTEITTYVNDRRLNLKLKLTDAQFWDILELPFVEGRPYTRDEVGSADYVAVITESTRQAYFGDQKAVGRTIEADGRNFRVLGVIDNKDIPFQPAHGDIYVPLSTTKDNLHSERYYGNYQAWVLAAAKADFSTIRNEYDRLLDQTRADNPDLLKLSAPMGSLLDMWAREFGGGDYQPGTAIIITVIALIMILFMLLPAINLVNINLSRIIERSSEIGVRKAFGASSLTLIGQFVIENIVLTVIGGAIGLILSAVVLKIVTDSGILPYGHLSVNFRLFAYSLMIILFFGLFSGVYPAYRMSRLHPVEALRGGRT
jgi:putative ABC transport system permease protein